MKGGEDNSHMLRLLHHQKVIVILTEFKRNTM